VPNGRPKDITQGQVCGKCYEEFIELANLFFNDVNKEEGASE
jgi:hypothetical protein